jgi:large subunit ribosomal protein L18
MNKDNKKLRISVQRSNTAISAQIIDDEKGVTVFSVSSNEIKEKMNPSKKAFATGELLGKKTVDKKLGTFFFDRGNFRYHGRVKALAEGMRAGGIKI